jgi:hypothetical protein
VQPSQFRQHRIVKGLHPETDPCDAGGPVPRQLGSAHALGIALDRHLDVRTDGEVGTHVLQERGHVLGLDQRGRATAEKYGLDRDARRPRSVGQQSDLALHGVEIPPHLVRRVQRRRVERAVVAALGAERDVNVETEGLAAGSRLGEYAGQGM